MGLKTRRLKSDVQSHPHWRACRRCKKTDYEIVDWWLGTCEQCWRAKHYPTVAITPKRYTTSTLPVHLEWLEEVLVEEP
jgi:hypothetical protein